MKKYAKELEELGVWKVVRRSTGEVVTVQGKAFDGMEEDEAEEIIDLLEVGDLVPDPSPGT